MITPDILMGPGRAVFYCWPVYDSTSLEYNNNNNLFPPFLAISTPPPPVVVPTLHALHVSTYI